MRKLDIARIVLNRDLVATGFSKSYAHDLSAGKKVPSVEKAALIEQKIGLPMQAWAPDADPLAEMWRLITSDSYPPTED